MSFDKSYIQNLTNKYRIAVAIAVLKEKPENVSIDAYIGELKNKLNNDSIEDLDFTVCSDDFNLDDNDETNLERHINDPRYFNDIANDRVTNDDIITGRHFNDNDKSFKDTVIEENRINESSNNVHRDIGLNNNKERSIDMACTSCSQNSESIFKDLNRNVGFDKIVGNERYLVDVNKNIVKKHDYTPLAGPSQSTNFQNNIDVDATICEKQKDIDNNININYIENVIKDTSSLLSKTVNEACENNKYTANVPETYFDSQATEIYSLYGFSQNYTHVSQSQNVDNIIIINDKFIKSKTSQASSENKTIIDNEPNIIQGCKNINIITNNLIADKHIAEINKENHISDNISIENVDDYINPTNNSLDSQSILAPTFENQNTMDINETFPQYAQDLNEPRIYENLTAEMNELNENIDNRSNRDVEMNEHNEISNNETEIVSFKVVEELNKVKNYINRRMDRRSSNDGSLDSGYKSDSQRSSYRSSFQLSGNWLNQSAHSLYEYITQSPLLVATQEIVSEIAQVLGQLIDKLHEEEKYPSFLEELLESVEYLLQDVLHGGCDDDSLLNKDEKIERLLLLNRSLHIQRYTLEKIVSILENLYTDLTDSEDIYEITHTVEIENMAYIFYILGHLLQIYSKGRPVSQEFKPQNDLKKSSIADIWRKKWNLTAKEDDDKEECFPKKCVLLKCNEVLNKLVIGCMERYSLIAFSALQCFNMLQS